MIHNFKNTEVWKKKLASHKT